MKLTCRLFLNALVTAGMMPFAASTLADDKGKSDLLIIDCHAHIYGEDETQYPIIENLYRPPAGKGTIAHLRQEMQSNGIRFVTAIQTSTFYRWDNRFTADSARDHSDFMVGVVILDPDGPTSEDLLRTYVADYNILGMRSILAASGRRPRNWES